MSSLKKVRSQIKVGSASFSKDTCKYERSWKTQKLRSGKVKWGKESSVNKKREVQVNVGWVSSVKKLNKKASGSMACMYSLLWSWAEGRELFCLSLVIHYSFDECANRHLTIRYTFDAIFCVVLQEKLEKKINALPSNGLLTFSGDGLRNIAECIKHEKHQVCWINTVFFLTNILHKL